MLSVAGAVALGGCDLFKSPPPPAKPVVAEPVEKKELVDLTPVKTEGTPTMGDVSAAKTATPATPAAPATPATPAIPAGAESYHLVVGSYTVATPGKTPEIAAAAAKFLTDNGVPSSVVMPTGANKFATVVTNEGFATAKDGDALHKKVVEIGKKYPGAKTPAFADSYFKKIKK
jgi:hypothetical protein